MAGHQPRPRVGVRVGQANGAQVRLWLLQLGAEPVETDSGPVAGVPDAPQDADVTRAQVAAFVHGLRGIGRDRGERFDDHGSRESWPRGSY